MNYLILGVQNYSPCACVSFRDEKCDFEGCYTYTTPCDPFGGPGNITK